MENENGQLSRKFAPRGGVDYYPRTCKRHGRWTFSRSEIRRKRRNNVAGSPLKMRGQFRGGIGGRDVKGRVARRLAAIRVAWIKEKFSAAEIAHTHARRLTQWWPLSVGRFLILRWKPHLYVQPPQHGGERRRTTLLCKLANISTLQTIAPLLCKVANIPHCYRTAFLCKLADICALFVHQHQRRIYSERSKHRPSWQHMPLWFSCYVNLRLREGNRFSIRQARMRLYRRSNWLMCG